MSSNFDAMAQSAMEQLTAFFGEDMLHTDLNGTQTTIKAIIDRNNSQINTGSTGEIDVQFCEVNILKSVKETVLREILTFDGKEWSIFEVIKESPIDIDVRVMWDKARSKMSANRMKKT